MKVAILSDGLDGHINQSIGIVEMLKEFKNFPLGK